MFFYVLNELCVLDQKFIMSVMVGILDKKMKLVHWCY